MANKYSIYTVLHAVGPGNKIQFYMCKKHTIAHFFGPTAQNPSGSVFQHGAEPPLNGGGDYAFPGGGFKVGTGPDGDGDWNNDIDFCKAAEREFIEECGRAISFPDPDDIDFDDADVECDVNIKRWTGPYARGIQYYYGAMFLKVTSVELETIKEYVRGCFVQADDAVRKIQTQVITTYAEVVTQYPLSPKDDELGEGFIHQLSNPDQFVASLEYNSNTSWYYDMICHLRDLS